MAGLFYEPFNQDGKIFEDHANHRFRETCGITSLPNLLPEENVSIKCSSFHGIFFEIFLRFLVGHPVQFKGPLLSITGEVRNSPTV